MFETKKVIIWFHFEMFIELFITNSVIFTRFLALFNFSRLIVKYWKKWNTPTKFEKNRTKPGNPYYLVVVENRTKSGTVLSETKWNLYYNYLGFEASLV